MRSYAVTIEGMSFQLVMYGGDEYPGTQDVVEALRRRGVSVWSDEMQRVRGYSVQRLSHDYSDAGRLPGQRGIYHDYSEEDSRYPSTKLWKLWRESTESRIAIHRPEYKRRGQVSGGQGSDGIGARDRGGSAGGAGQDSAGT